MALKNVAAPTEQPITADEAKAFMRIDGADEDALIGSLIKAATRMAEKFTSRLFITQTWDLWLDHFPRSKMTVGPGEWHDGVIEAPISLSMGVRRFIEIPKPPLQSASFLKTYDEADQEHEFSADKYFVDTQGEPGRLALNYSESWPTTILRPANGIQIQFVAGYGDAAAVPEDIKTAIKMITSFLYENRGCAEGTAEMPIAAASLLEPYRIMRL